MATQWLRIGSEPSFTDSCTGTDSTTLHVSPAASMRALRSSMSAVGQTSPAGTWRAVTTPVQPAIFNVDSGTGSSGPIQRMVCSMIPFVALSSDLGAHT